MESLECQIINKSDSRIIEIEKLRREVFHVDNGKYFIREISNDKIIVIGCFLQKKLVIYHHPIIHYLLNLFLCKKNIKEMLYMSAA